MISLDNIRHYHYVQDAFITGPLLQKNLDGLQIIGTSGELQGSEIIILLRVDIYDWHGEEEGGNTRTVHHATTFSVVLSSSPSRLLMLVFCLHTSSSTVA